MGRQRSSLPRDFPDRTLRDAVANPHNLRTVLRRAVPHLAERLDYARMELLTPAFLLDDWSTGSSWRGWRYTGRCCGGRARSGSRSARPYAVHSSGQFVFGVRLREWSLSRCVG